MSSELAFRHNLSQIINFHNDLRSCMKDAWANRRDGWAKNDELNSLEAKLWESCWQNYDTWHRINTFLMVCAYTEEWLCLLSKKYYPRIEYDLRLMSVNTGNDLVNEGYNLIVVALVGTNLHIRIFDANEKRVVDKAENELTSGDTLTMLKKQLNPLPDEPGLSQEQKQKIIQDATSIAGHNIHIDKGIFSKYKPVLRELGIDLSRCCEWHLLTDCEKIRNCLLHTNGRVDLMRNKSKIEETAKRRRVDIELNRLRIPSDFLNSFVEKIKTFITKLYEQERGRRGVYPAIIPPI